jgi:hypothetical protein
LGVALAAIVMWAPPALGAFPGRDGDLVVATGGGLELVVPATGASSSLCPDVLICGHPAQPSFSPNGLAIAFVDTTSHRPVVIAADGSCLWCLLGTPLTNVTGSRPAFTAGGRAVTMVGSGVWRNGLVGVSLSGGGRRPLVKGPVDGAVWSSRGLVALARGGWIWVGRPGHGRLRRLARGRSPSFSPDGGRLALVRDGHVWIVRVADGAERRLVPGGAPAWSPSGRRIAYVAPGGGVEIVAAQGGRPGHVGSVRGTALDWQPLPTSARGVCAPPAGSTVVASSAEAVVFSQGRLRAGIRFYGCLKALGRTRLLLHAAYDFGGLIAVRLAGRFAALESDWGNQYAVGEGATLYDLGSGQEADLADVSWSLNPRPIVYGLDFLALDTSGFAAWRETTQPTPNWIAAISCPSVSLCVAGDGAGNVLSSTNPTGGSTAWSSAAVAPSQGIRGLSCPTVSLCVAVGWAGDVLSSTDPTAGASAWTDTTPAPGSYLSAVSCPSVSLCVAGGFRGDGGPAILTSSDPTGGASSWSSVPVPSGKGITAVSCPSVSLCVATTNTGDVLTSTNPTGGASAWTASTVDTGTHGLNAVSCPSVSLCVAVDTDGNALTSTDPAGGASVWTKSTIDTGANGLDAVSCPSVALCTALDYQGNVLTATDPTGGASAWTKASLEPPSLNQGPLGAVSCPSVSLCIAADGFGNVLTSPDPTGGANSWTRASVDVPGCSPQSDPCASERLFAYDDQGYRMLDTAPPGRENSIGNIALDGNSLTLSWTHDGIQRQLQLR